MTIARRQLNWKSGVETERQRLVGLILDKVELSDEREKELAKILVGQTADSLNSVRVLVVQALAKNAKSKPQNALYLSFASQFDRSKAVREKAKRVMRQYGLAFVAVEDTELEVA